MKTILIAGGAGYIGSHLYFQLAPGRFGFDKIEKTTRPWNKTHGKYCALIGNVISRKLKYPIDQEKILLWRGYIIKPNTFPYFKSHFLIMSSDFRIEGIFPSPVYITRRELDLDSTEEKLIFNRTVGLRDSWSKKQKA